VILASWQVGQLVWAMLWFAFFFMLIWAVVTVFVDLFRRRDISGWTKALWLLFIVFLPWLGVFLYLVFQGTGSSEKQFEVGYYGLDQSVPGVTDYRVPAGYYSGGVR
jgi:hypothetical protein